MLNKKLDKYYGYLMWRRAWLSGHHSAFDTSAPGSIPGHDTPLIGGCGLEPHTPPLIGGYGLEPHYTPG